MADPVRSGKSEPVHSEEKRSPGRRFREMQSAARFPLKLSVQVKSESGGKPAETRNISANGVLFRVDSEMAVGARVDFTIGMPASVLGAPADVQVNCRGRVVRCVAEGERRDVGVVIDEYRFERL